MPPHVSVENQLPQDLYEAMGRFIESHPQWDQYRLVQVAIAGFLFQQGSQERMVAQHYLKGLSTTGQIHARWRSIAEL